MMKSVMRTVVLLFACIGFTRAAGAQEMTMAMLSSKYNLPQGQETYNRACGVCHDSGVMNAPKVCNIAEWQPRMAQGMQSLITHVIDGLGGMPAKGGLDSLTLAECSDAVAYMMSLCDVTVANK